MKLRHLPLFLLCLVSIAIYAEEAAPAAPAKDHPYGDPKKFEKEILAFEAADKTTPPPANAVLVVGSSSIRNWHPKIKEDLAPLTIIPRGFGGSNMNDLLYYTDRIVLPYQPRAIVVYEGANDLPQGLSTAQVVATFHAFVVKVHEKLPACRIYLLAIKPSIKYWHLWPKSQETNQALAAECAATPNVTFVAEMGNFMGADGTPRPDLYVADKLHLSRDGYVIWRDAIKPVLLKAEGQYEAAPAATPAK